MKRNTMWCAQNYFRDGDRVIVPGFMKDQKIIGIDGNSFAFRKWRWFDTLWQKVKEAF